MPLTGIKRFWAALLSFTVPGAGQLYIGRIRTGLTLLLSAVTVTVAIVYYAGVSGGRHALLLVYLGLAVPVLYFYSMYDILQATSRRTPPPDSNPNAEGTDAEPDADADVGTAPAAARAQGLGLIGAGLLLLLLVRPTETAGRWLLPVGDYLPAAGLLVIGVVLYAKRGISMYRLGRVTAAVAIVAVGAILLWDQIKGRNDIALLIHWWPALLIMLGIEIVAVSIGVRTTRKQLSFDAGGLALAAVIAVTALGVTQFNALPFNWIDQWKVDVGGLTGFGEEKGFQYTKNPVAFDLPEGARDLVIDNPNGKVTMREGDVDGIRVETVVWVDIVDQAEADKIAEKSVIEISGDEKVTVSAKGEPFGVNGGGKPRMNLVVTVPRTPNPKRGANALPELGSAGTDAGTADNGAAGPNSTTAEMTAPTAPGEKPAPKPPVQERPSGEESVPEPERKAGLQTITIRVMNGPIDAAGLNADERVTVETANGEIALRDIRAAVKATTKNGGVEAFDIAGDAEIETFNGTIRAERIGGSAIVSTVNGSVKLAAVAGDIEADTKNGAITVDGAQRALLADTLNGRIEVRSATVGGTWDIGSAVGEIALFVPENGDYDVSGAVTFGDIETDLPLKVSKKTITGEIGEGTYRIGIDANSSIAVKRYQS
ncbi:hypothetical protein BG53_08825 [Paenibacillus darwinianus]|uniref:DUF4097 domain-containing protein n=1 Tax=Paenibacillus darwinianus TaxID=1380763 RepID=A0A9W5W6K5_9BACL|nr:DUF4097 family beta strand repeat-containing protein [Paenibacillus darwinianus]EXX85327.1 hypothetical protein BG53_08825 [Paenibacillus darwinianus]EXX86151.1 hypothetical protein CH50_07900 [Paenibacillus darwinianus]EXX86315.1 hypothetical protein BG52_06785 [Paenibacillus darwinianus]